MGFPSGSVGKESACTAGDTGNVGSIPWIGKIPWRMATHKWQPTLVFLPRMDRGAWQAAVQRVAESWIQPSD